MHADRRPLALVVEDNQDACDIYSAFLTRAGFDVRLTHDAAAAFTEAIECQPDVIIADVRLPGGIDGLRLTMKLRLDRRTTSTPIIVVSGDALLADRGRALAAGCDVFLPKPCRPDVLAEQALTLITA